MAVPPFDVTIKGMALSDQGLTDGNVYDGLGLLTMGLICGCQNIWYGPWSSTGATSISTSWTLFSSGVTTVSWTLYPGPTLPTVWVDFSTYNIEDC